MPTSPMATPSGTRRPMSTNMAMKPVMATQSAVVMASCPVQWARLVGLAAEGRDRGDDSKGETEPDQADERPHQDLQIEGRLVLDKGAAEAEEGLVGEQHAEHEHQHPGDEHEHAASARAQRLVEQIDGDVAAAVPKR